jgi:hypothetical protein
MMVYKSLRGWMRRIPSFRTVDSLPEPLATFSTPTGQSPLYKKPNGSPSSSRLPQAIKGRCTHYTNGPIALFLRLW